MRIGLFTDTHFGLKKANKLIYNWQYTAFKKAINIFKKNKVDIVIFLGDLFDNRYSNTTWINNKIIEDVASNINQFETYMILGNHDLYYKDSRIPNSLDIIVKGRFENIKIIYEPTKIKDIVLCPWLLNSDEVKNIPKGKYLFGHFEFNGAIMVNGAPPCQHGLDVNIFKEYKEVYSGHFHLKQKIQNVNYLGTMMPLSWAEYDSDHGVHILDTNNKLEFYPIDINMFKKIEWTGQEIDSNLIQDKIVKIIVKNEDNEELEKLLSEISHKSYNSSLVFPINKIEDEDLEYEVTSEQELFNKYLEKYLPKHLNEHKFRTMYQIVRNKIDEIS